MPFLYIGNLGVDYDQDSVEKDFGFYGKVGLYFRHCLVEISIRHGLVVESLILVPVVFLCF